MRCSITSCSPLSRLIARAFLTCALVVAASFCALAQPSGLTVVYPNGGQNLVVDSTVNVIWFLQGTTITGTLNVDYSIDSGATWTRIDTATARSGLDTIKWKVPNQPTTRGFVRIRSAADSTRSGKSRNPFNIVTKPVPIITVTYPNGGNTFQFDSTIKIRWNTQYVTGQLNVEYSIDSGATWTLIKNVTAHAGADSLSWTIPHDSTTRALVRVGNADTSDVSNRTFTIRAVFKPGIKVNYPNGGEVFYADSTEIIRWNAQDITGQLRIDFSVDSGKTWTTIGNRPARQGDDTLSWKVPNDSTTTALVRIRQLQGGIADTSDAFFTIKARGTQPAVTLRLLAPNGGEKLKADSTVYIVWNSTGITGQYIIAYSPDKGVTWTPVNMVPAKDGRDSVQWKVPNDSTTTALVGITSSDGLMSDTSNATFTILKRSTASDVPQPRSDAARTLQLLGSYPNPASGATEIRWEQSAAGEVIVRIYDAAGQPVSAYRAGRYESGSQHLDLDVEALPAGTYLYELQSGAARTFGTMTIVG
jgi:hypothetical protein